ncbi:hypothetical protein BC936DRAFT_146852 [Jimgerdemannia flammicorona]|uniref:Uncharacterized protein n=1 Tax=Jimgerdemannia flammicorona TaxID=994334 RepID=A0A433DL91_9FUNG|nr:hypothetical protein BC936DRAFT_146852 [Jimgerdemannia flammicorona]
MAQTLLSSPYQSVFDSALKLLIVLLDGGNRNVQDVLENYFLSIREERFFYCMHSRIQSGISSLEEAQHLLIREAQKQERQNFVVTAEPAHPTETSSPRIRHHRTHKPHRVSFSTGRELLRHASYANLMEPKKRWSIHGTPPESTALTQLSAMNETAEFGTAKEDFEVMKDIMRLLQLMVEGHNSHLQVSSDP